MKVEETPLRDLARILVYYLFPLIIRLLPAGVDFALYRRIGNIFYKLGGKKMDLVEKNLTRAFPKHNKAFIKEQARQYFQNHFIDRLQLFSFPGLKKANIDRYIQMEGLERLHQVLKEGRGCILIHGHFGPAQLFIAAIALAGFPVTQIGFVTREGYSYIGLNVAVRKRLELESTLPGEIFYADQFMKPIFIRLKKNQVICNAGDGTGGGQRLGKTINLPFLGIQHSFPVGSAALAQKTGAALVPLLMKKEKNGRYIAELQEPIQVEAGKKGVDRAVRHFAALFEERVKKQPGLWHFWDEFPSGPEKTEQETGIDTSRINNESYS